MLPCSEQNMLNEIWGENSQNKKKMLFLPPKRFKT